MVKLLSNGDILVVAENVLDLSKDLFCVVDYNRKTLAPYGPAFKWETVLNDSSLRIIEGTPDAYQLLATAKALELYKSAISIVIDKCLEALREYMEGEENEFTN